MSGGEGGLQAPCRLICPAVAHPSLVLTGMLEVVAARSSLTRSARRRRRYLKLQQKNEVSVTISVQTWCRQVGEWGQ